MNVNLVDVVVPAATTGTVMSVVVEHFTEAGFTIENTGAQAFDVFEVHAKMHADGPVVPLATIAGDYSSPVWPLRRADALVTLANGSVGRLFINVAGIHTLIFKASNNHASTAGEVSIRGQLT